MSRSEAWLANRRALGYALAGATLAFLAANVRLHVPFGNTDVDQIWAAARVLLDGRDPYAMIGPGRPVRFQYPFYYPLTAAILGLPLGLLPLEAARAFFMIVSGGLMGYAVGRYRPWLWPAFLSIPFFIVARNGQWAALFTAALILPWLGAVVAAKPNIALAIAAGSRDLRSAGILAAGALAVVGLSLAVDPDWPWKWRDALSGAGHFTPLIVRPGGFLVLLALLRFRDPDARLLLTLALVPQTGMIYEALPAAIVARTRAQSAFLALTTHVAWYSQFVGEPGPPASFAADSWNEGKLVLVGGLLVPLALVLWRGFKPTRNDQGGLPEASQASTALQAL